MNTFDISALLRLPDASSRCEAFYTALMHEITTDDEPWSKKSYAILRALMNKDAEDVFLSICGWTPLSIAKRALIVRDSDETFHSAPVPAVLCAKWEDGTEKSSVCNIDPKTLEIIDFAFDDLEGKNFAEANELILSMCIEDEMHEFNCRFAEKESDVDAFTYWVNPASANKTVAMTELISTERRHIKAVKKGDTLLVDGEKELAISDAQLTETSIGNEWNVELQSSHPYPVYLYASELEEGMVDVVVDCKMTLNFSDKESRIGFRCVPNLEDYADSMLHDSNTEVASFHYERGDLSADIDLMVRGEVLVHYSGAGWKSPSRFPKELRDLIKKYPNHWPDGAASEGIDVNISRNNWFEYIVRVVYNGETVLSDGYLCEDNLESMDPVNLMFRMADLYKEVAKNFVNN